VRENVLQAGDAAGGIRTFAVATAAAAAAASADKEGNISLHVAPLQLVIGPNSSPTTALLLAVPCARSVHAVLDAAASASARLRLVSGHAEGSLRIADGSTSGELRVSSTTAGNGTAITGLVYGRSDRVLVSCAGMREVKCFRVEEKETDSHKVELVCVCTDVPVARPVNADGLEGVVTDGSSRLPGLVTFGLVAAPAGTLAVALRRVFAPRVIHAIPMLGQLQLLRSFCIAAPHDPQDTVASCLQAAAASAVRCVRQQRRLSAAVHWELAALAVCGAPLLREARQNTLKDNHRCSSSLQEQERDQVGAALPSVLIHGYHER
jgi:hypothetical protein